jgi:hypothetical protein
MPRFNAQRNGSSLGFPWIAVPRPEMLTVRNEQMHALAVSAGAAHQRQLVEHCFQFAPRLCQLRGAAAVARLVAEGVQRARAAGWQHRGPMRFWVEMMLTQGSRWHDDPQLRAVNRHLDRTDLAEHFRADLVYEALQAHLACADGADKHGAREALQRVLAADWTAVTTPAPAPETRALALLAQLHPRKLEVVGQDAATRLVRSAGEACHRLGLNPDEAQVLISGLMFGFGHGVLADPMLPWVQQTLQPEPGSRQRCARLARKTRWYVRAVLAYWAEGHGTAERGVA